MGKYIIFFAVLFVAVSWACSKKDEQQAKPDENQILKISLFQSGEIYAGNRAVSLEELDGLLEENARKNGVVWYYREQAQEETPPQVKEAINLIIRHRRPISMSSKPDFSDTIDEEGIPRPRKK